MPFDKVEEEWKIWITGADGQPQGYINPEGLSSWTVRTWMGRPHARHFEVLHAIKHGEYWCVFRHGALDKYELTDADYIRVLSASEVRPWLVQNGYEPSDDPASVLPNRSSGMPPLTPEVAVARPTVIQRLFDAMVRAECSSSRLAWANQHCVELESEGTRPADLDWPDRQVERKQRFVDVLSSDPSISAGERDQYLAGDGWETTWSRALIELKASYEDWVSALDAAIDAVPGAAPIMDAGEPRLPERWTTKCLGELRELRGLLAPMVYGKDGLGLARRLCRPLPERFGELVELLGRRRLTLMDVREAPRPDGESGAADQIPEEPAKAKRKWTKEDAADAAKKYLRHNTFPGLRPLARLLDCPHTTLSDGIDADAELAAMCKPEATPSRSSPVTGRAAGDDVKTIEAKPEEDPAFVRADNMIDQLIKEAPYNKREQVQRVYQANKTAIDQMALTAVEKGDLETVRAVQESIRDLLLGGCSPNR